MRQSVFIRGMLIIIACALGACSTSNPQKGKKAAQSEALEEHKLPDIAQEESGQPLRVNIADEPQSLDPRKARELAALTMTRMLFEGLTRINPHEKPELAAAERVDISDDLTIYTFKLRKSTWSNGDAVTAEDFEYAWKKTLDPLFPADNAAQLYVIKNGKKFKEGKAQAEEVGIKALDALTLRVVLEAPTPYFLELASFPIFFPVNRQVDRANPYWADNASTYVSNGPFLLKTWKHHDIIEMEKNRQYWDSKTVKIHEIQMMMVKEETEFKMFEKEELDWAGSPLSVLPLDALPILKTNKELKSKPLLGTYFLRTNVAKPPFDKASMRRAFAFAINRQEIVDHVTHGSQIAATGLVPLSMGLQSAPFFKDGNKAEARRLFEQSLKESGLTVRDLSNFTLLYSSGERNHLIAQAIQQQWFDAFGVRVKLEVVERKVYFDRLSKQDYHIASGSWIADFNDPVNFLEIFKSKSNGMNNTNWENAEYSSLLSASTITKDAAARKELLQKSEQIIMADMPIIPIFHYSMLYVNNGRVKDVALSSMGNIDFKWASIESENIARSR